ncbi:MAG: MASE1 domain-containing protein [Rhodanobacteraceae bacterium]
MTGKPLYPVASDRLHTVGRWLLARPLWLRAMMLFAVIAVTHPWLYAHSSFYWYLPGGLRFMLLLLLPWRYWPSIIGAELFARFARDGTAYPFNAEWTFWAVFSQPLASLPVVWWMKQRWQVRDIEVPRGMLFLLLGIGLFGFANTAANFCYVLVTPDRFFERNVLNWVVTAFVGATDVALILTPLAIALVRWSSALVQRYIFWRDLGLATLIALTLMLITAMGPDQGGLRGDYLPLLMPLPLVYFAYRYGWRGATVALVLLGLIQGINIHGGVFPGVNSRNLLLLDLSGFMALLLGSAMDSQHRAKQHLAGRNRELKELGSQLQKAARRNLQLEDRQLKRVVAALHDELGQNLTALRTHLKLAEPELAEAGVVHVGNALSQQVDRMRESVRDLMNGLRPAALDDLGLIAVLRTGPLAEFLHQAGVHYTFRLAGDAGLAADLHPDLATAIYRIAQECATNCVRHAGASEFSLRLLMTRRHGDLLLVLEARDDGIGLPPKRVTALGGRGLQGMRDRVLAFDGVMHVRQLKPHGTRIRVLLAQ